MAYDFETTTERSELMKKIHSTDTKAEIALRKALWANGIRYRKNYAKLPGKPDIAIVKNRIAIFIDGEFWHGYNWEEKRQRIKPNRSYWIPKIEKTIKRDAENNEKIRDMGWTVLRFWDHEIKKDLEKCTLEVLKKIHERQEV